MKTGYDQHFKKVKRTAVAPQPLVSKKRRAHSQVEKKSSFPVMPLLSFIFIVFHQLHFRQLFGQHVVA